MEWTFTKDQVPEENKLILIETTNGNTWEAKRYHRTYYILVTEDWSTGELFTNDMPDYNVVKFRYLN